MLFFLTIFQLQLYLCLGLISAVVMYVVDNVIRSENIHSIIYNIVDIALLINPYYTASTSLMHFAIIAIGNRDCTLCFSTPNPDCKYEHNFFCYYLVRIMESYNKSVNSLQCVCSGRISLCKQ